MDWVNILSLVDHLAPPSKLSLYPSQRKVRPATVSFCMPGGARVTTGPIFEILTSRRSPSAFATAIPNRFWPLHLSVESLVLREVVPRASKIMRYTLYWILDTAGGREPQVASEPQAGLAAPVYLVVLLRQ
jgi:hypothetical protein